MYLERLRIRHFRNLESQELELPPGGVGIVGDNAQGKSNLLEAIYYLETFRSFRGSPDARLVRFGEDLFRLEGTLAAGPSEAPAPGGREELEVSAAYQRSSKTKKVSVAGDAVDRLGDAVGLLGAVIFTPDDVRIVTDGPQERRRFLNVVLCLNDPEYLRHLQRFRQVLSQRNAALRDGPRGPDLASWDGILIRTGAALTAARARWLGEAEASFAEYCREVSGEGGCGLRYEPGIPGVTEGGTAEEVEAIYRRGLDASRERELRQGTTVVGPHRDEVAMTVPSSSGDRDLRAYGSGGQRRTAALALRLLEADSVRSARAREPLLLLDDVFAELDEARSARVLELLDRAAVGQVILTAPKEGDVRFRRDRLPRWTIRAGEVTT